MKKRSKILLSKISKTKKRLSDERWHGPLMILGILHLFIVLTFIFGTLSTPYLVGEVMSYVPILQKKSVVESSIEAIQAQTVYDLNNQTDAIVLNEQAYIFGTVTSFTEKYLNSRNKIVVPHIENQPQLITLIRYITQKRRKFPNKPVSEIAVFIPSSNWPMSTVIKTIHYLKREGLYKEVVIGPGII